MPLVSEVHLDAVLTEISQAFKNEAFAADQIWPVVNVKKDSDVYYQYDKSNLRVEETRWAPKTAAKEINWGVTRAGYVTERHALAELIEDDEVQNADAPLDIPVDTAEILTEKMLIRKEKRLAAILQATGNYDAGAFPSLAAADRWDNYASADSDPNQDVQTARKVIYKKTLLRANLIALPFEVYESVREHPKVLERIKYVERGIITPQILASLWDFEKVLVLGSGENTALEGAADAVDYIWGKSVYIGFVEPRPRLKRPSWGYHFQSQRFLMERWRDDPRKGDMHRLSYKDVPKLVTKSSGYLIQTAIS